MSFPNLYLSPSLCLPWNRPSLLISGIAYSSLSPTSKGLSSSHASVGLGLFIILVIQFLLGYASHIFFNSQVLKYRAINFVHAGLGITIIGLSFWDVILGAEAWSTAKPHLKVIKYSLLGYGLSIVLIYCLGFLLIPRELENNRLNYNSEHKILKYKLASAPAMNSETHLNQIEKYQSKLSIPKPLEEICGPVSLFYHNTDLKQVVIEESGESGDENQRASVFEEDDEDDEKSMKEIRNSISSRKEKKRKSKDLKRANKSFELVRKNGYKESTSQGKKSPHEFESTSAISASTSLNESTFLGGLDGQDELEDEFNEIRFSGVAL